MNTKSRPKQYKLAVQASASRAHGGEHAKGKRKSHRPLSTKHPIHLVLHSSKAKGVYSLRHANNKKIVHAIIKRQARKFFVQIRNYVNVGNHLHIEVKISARKEFQKFLKSITCLIARRVTGAKKGHKFGRFWDHLAFTRVLSSYFELEILRRYFHANFIEAEVGPEARQYYLSCWYGPGG